MHPAMYPLVAWLAAGRIRPRPDLVLAHEPASASFVATNWPTITFSHGLERRGWLASLRYEHLSGERIRLRSRILFPIWRISVCDYALRHSPAALVLNREDFDFCVNNYGRNSEDTFLYKNGVNLEPHKAILRRQPAPDATPVVLFLGSWLPRKGIRTLVQAAQLIRDRGIAVKWLVAGTGIDADQVLDCWPERLRDQIEVVPSFTQEKENDLMHRSDVFVLPSFFEGQPLALLQAMATGLAVVATDTCGQRDLVQHDRNGLLFQPGDALALANQLARCISSEALRSQLGEEARRSVAGRSWDAAAAEVADFVEKTYARLRTGTAVR